MRPTAPAVSALASGEPPSDAPRRRATGAARDGLRGFFDGVFRSRLQWLLALTFVAGLAATAGAALWMSNEVERKASAEVAMRADDVQDELQSRLLTYGDLVYSIRGLMVHSEAEGIGRDEFHRFVGSLAVAERYPGLTNISFSYHVPHAAREAFEQRMRAEYQGLLPGLQPFEIKPPGERAEYDVVSFMEPLADNAVAVGLDLGTDPLRHDVVRRARDSGTLAASAGMTLKRDADAPTTSVLLRVATYQGGSAPGTPEARRKAFTGVAGVAIRVQKMLEAVLTAEQLKQLHIVIMDVTEEGGVPAGTSPHNGLLFDSQAANQGAVSYAGALTKYTMVRPLRVGDRDWEARVSPLHDPIETVERLLPQATAAAGVMITLLLCGLLKSLANARTQGATLRRNVAALEFHRRRLAETQRIASIGGWEWDIRQGKQIWSDELYRVIGRAVGDPAEPTAEYFISHVVHPDDISHIRAVLKRVVEKGEPQDVECRIVLPDGTERIVSSATRLETAEDGTRTRLVGTVRDITEAHHAATRERAQLVFIQTMMDAIPAPVFQKDPFGRFRACNNAWCEFAGKPREAIIGRTLEEFLPGPHIELIREQDRMLLARPAARAFEVTIPNAAGEPRQLTVHKASYLDEGGQIAGLVGILFDVTDAKLAAARLEQTIAELDRRHAVAGLLGEFSEVLQSCMTVAEAHESAARFLPRLVPGSSGVLYRIDPAHRHGAKVAGWGVPSGAPATLAAEDCVAVRRNRARKVENPAEELNCRHFTADPQGCYACLPLSAQGELIGLLHVQHPNLEQGPLWDAEICWAAVTTAAEHIGLALTSLTLRESLREQATHDKLTGLYNRHYLTARFAQELARLKRDRRPLSVIMLDIDHFKRFNDTFGHAAGDHVLREVAQAIERHGRESDVACRYGGEEFVLFLPEASADVALERAQQIRDAVKALNLESEGRPLSAVTVSAGVATYPEHGDDPDTLLQFADRALYRAKELGRDRVVMAPLGAGTTASRQGLSDRA